MTVNEEEYEDRRVYWVWISMVLGAGNPQVWELCRGYRHIREFAEALKDGSFGKRLSERQNERTSLPFSAAKELTDRCAARGIKTLSFRDEDYPARLKKIPNPPAVLFLRGDTQVIGSDRTTVAFVGTRTPTAYSVRTAERLAAELAGRGITIITGIENGIDAIAAEAAGISGCAAAVCGKGILCEDYPPVQTDRIAENGVILAEYTSREDFGRTPFDRRNRMLCGLADAVVFIECRADSAGLNNAGHAAILGKPVFVLPPADIYDPRFFGQRDLIRAGARLILSAEDITAGIGLPPSKLPDPEAVSRIGSRKKHRKTSGKKKQEPPRQPAEDTSDRENVKNEQKNPAEGLHKSEMSATIDISGLSEEQKKIYETLKEKGPLHINQLADITDMDITDVITGLTMLRMENAVEELSGKQFGAK